MIINFVIKSVAELLLGFMMKPETCMVYKQWTHAAGK
jgi:hypothetical protein